MWAVTLKIKAPVRECSSTLFDCNLLMCGGHDDDDDGDDGDCWLPVISPPPAHVIIVTADDGSFVPHWGQQASLDLF